MAAGVSLAAALALAGCAQAADSPPPPAPDYTQSAAWAARPGRASSADTVPPGLDRGLPADQKADAFLVHPTTYLSGDAPNARYDEPGATSAQIDRGVLRFQASVFNACCRIHAPHYRQAALAAFRRDGDGKAQADLGSLPGVGAGADLKPPIPHLTGARCQGAALEVAIPWSKHAGFVDLLAFFASYHIFDYNLFYANVRINAQQRVAAWRTTHPG